ncbi:hypothetical protein BDA96_10G204900 [Sorghum bicolor]|uniref:Uncharacterized protein n=1 Tax=Sorghum bicolor TaxID=4558 RepID=A0A921Q5K4_SORBI|nr:hypothetical protein BDA96_10G204900 [Sorghum bicolor]
MAGLDGDYIQVIDHIWTVLVLYLSKIVLLVHKREYRWVLSCFNLLGSNDWKYFV